MPDWRQYGVSIRITDPLLHSIPDSVMDLVRDEQRALCDQMLENLFSDQASTPPRPPPWLPEPDLHCVYCGKKGHIEREDYQDPELIADRHRCLECDKTFWFSVDFSA